ncbi:hypothetical protein EGI26_05525 [Lacihabitans sp. CCS-44]|uniref:hypothetical protein n=1 Tax=Lacihabitans sp. CCS-44 TaxID=2487331 RepID=UPI0020CD9B04|nr:hypothetical protein [Lacihabitans sp. CCS-44]MCP9754625.1 hypothetical protein [Lacihabitans sp. CCS-44]
MNSTEIKAIILQTIQFLVIIMIISFVLDIGFDRFTKEPFMELVSNWFASIFTLSKMGLWVLISLVYSYFRVTKLKKS